MKLKNLFKHLLLALILMSHHAYSSNALEHASEHTQKLNDGKLLLFTLDYRYAKDTFKIHNNVTCTSTSAITAKNVGINFKTAWENISGEIQLKFKIKKLIFCDELLSNNTPISALYIKQSNEDKETVFFSVLKDENKSKESIQRVFSKLLFALAERHFGQHWKKEWDKSFQKTNTNNAVYNFNYQDAQTERADLFSLLLTNQKIIHKHIIDSQNKVLLEKLVIMHHIMNQDWEIDISMPKAPLVADKKSKPSKSSAQSNFAPILEKSQYHGIKPIKNLSAKEAEKVFGIRGLQFAPDNFAPDLSFKLGYAHTAIKIGTNTCKSSTPINTAINARHISSAWKKLPAYAHEKLNLKFVFFCSDITAKNGSKIGGLATSYHNTVFISIPSYNAKDGDFIEKTFLHELFHYAEFKSRSVTNNDWNNVFSGYINSYKKSLFDTKIGSGKRGFLNAYATTYSAEDRAEMFSELVIKPARLMQYAKNKNDTILSMKIKRMQHIMLKNWGIKFGGS